MAINTAYPASLHPESLQQTLRRNGVNAETDPDAFHMISEQAGFAAAKHAEVAEALQAVRANTAWPVDMQLQQCADVIDKNVERTMQAMQRIDQFVATKIKTAEDEIAAVIAPTGEVAQTQQEIRAYFKSLPLETIAPEGMNEAKAIKRGLLGRFAVAMSMARAGDPSIAAVLVGPAYLSGFDEHERKALRAAYSEKKAPQAYKRLKGYGAVAATVQTQGVAGVTKSYEDLMGRSFGDLNRIRANNKRANDLLKGVK